MTNRLPPPSGMRRLLDDTVPCAARARWECPPCCGSRWPATEFQADWPGFSLAHNENLEELATNRFEKLEKGGCRTAIASTVASDDDNHAEEGSRSRRTTTTMMAISGWELLLSDTISQRLVISCHRRYRHLNGAATTGGAVAPISSSRSSKSHRHCSSSSTCEFIISTFAVLDMSRRASPTSASWLPRRCPRQFDGGILPRIGADTCQGPRNNQLRPQETRLFQST